jgi:6,7-dimethyl-8-ribityllumazine synthase
MTEGAREPWPGEEVEAEAQPSVRDGGPAELQEHSVPEIDVPPAHADAPGVLDEEEVPAEEDELPRLRPPEHVGGELEVPSGYNTLTGSSSGGRRAVAVVIGRFNGGITSRLLETALDELERAGVAREAVTVMPVPGAFELPLAAMALAKTRRFACVVALGCVIRGETPHFDYVAGEAASGLQLAAIETGIPVSFGVLTCETVEQAEARIGKGAEAVRSALEMADLFSQLRTTAAQG